MNTNDNTNVEQNEFEDDEDFNFSDNNMDNNDEIKVDDWGDLVYGDEPYIPLATEEDSQALLKRALESRRKEQAKLSAFWKCGKCEFLNHPSRAICMGCQQPQLDVIHEVLTCKQQLQTCPKCYAFVVPDRYENHIQDCQPMGMDNKEINQSWMVELTNVEKGAINHVNNYAKTNSTDISHDNKLIATLKSIDEIYGNDETLHKLLHFMEWTVPITIRVNCSVVIPLLLKDTHYRSLFETGTGGGGTDTGRRELEEKKMFGDVYDKCKNSERPKYGCLNVGLTPEGCKLALGYGDAYFTLNDTTVRWRTSLTNGDSFNVNGVCGTLKHCKHLLTQMAAIELQDLVEAAVLCKKGGHNQTVFREIQIHGPVILSKDIQSLHCPKKFQKEKIHATCFQEFCRKNKCELLWF